MTVFKLPDLGEGLPDAEIVKWNVKEGETIQEGNLMVEMSTAKAVVEVPAPYTGKVVKLHGKAGDVIKTGAPLVTFELAGEEVKKEPEKREKTEPPDDKKAPEKRAQETPAGGAEVFKLPDLGEGLQEGEIVKWAVKEGDSLKEGDPMVEMSTDKAVVEVPSPFSGKVAKLYGKEGDIIKTGAPLIAIDTGKPPAAEKAEKKAPKEEPVTEAKGDAGTVVGAMVVGEEVSTEQREARDGIIASPAVRAFARKAKADLASIKGTGAGGEITLQDVKKAATGAPASQAAAELKPASGDISISPPALALAKGLGLEISNLRPAGGRKVVTKGDVLTFARAQMGQFPSHAPAATAAATAKEVKAAPKVRAAAKERGMDLRLVRPTGHQGNVTLEDLERTLSGGVPAQIAAPGRYSRPERPYDVSGEPQKLTGPRRVMAQTMAKANAEVCHTSLFDEVSIARWGEGADITVRLMRAVIAACFAEPALNAWFDGEKLEKTLHRSVHLGVAVDSPKGLFVPVIKGADALDGQGLRQELNRLRKAIAEGAIKANEMSGGTITLSNFGMIAGRFATPVIVPPEVAIIGIGGLYEKLVMTEKGIENQRFIPVSLTFDHRASTGGEAARFLKVLLTDLALAF